MKNRRKIFALFLAGVLTAVLLCAPVYAQGEGMVGTPGAAGAEVSAGSPSGNTASDGNGMANGADGISGGIEDAAEGVVNGAESLARGVGDAADEVVNGVGDAVGDAAEGIGNAADEVINGAETGTNGKDTQNAA
ncbi:MAG: hypothetical protein IJO52_03610, partial [Clostridia bacterium]|nr:hypothetical protein [Clostridia bacterium]